MLFEDWMLRKQFLSKIDYLTIGWHCTKGLDGHTDSLGFLQPDIQSCASLNDIKRLPFGDVLMQPGFSEICNAVYQRSGATCLDDLILMWRQFHVENFEAISEYSLTSTFGKNLHRNVSEKKLCAHYIAKSEDFGRMPLVHDGDHVIIPEGTSAFYVGLAIAGLRRDITFITSNGPFLRELSENPVLAANTRNVLVVGGELEADTKGSVASRGFVGIHTEREFESAMSEPGATVLVSSVNGLLPVYGPFAPTDPTPKTASTRYAILKYAMQKNIRQVVFVSDYTKMLPSKRTAYGEPIFSDENEWYRFMNDHRHRISIVAAPPPSFGEVPEYSHQAPRLRPIAGLNSKIDSAVAREYVRCAKELDEEIVGSGVDSRYFEPYLGMKSTLVSL